MKSLNIIFLGRSGSGKGTQLALLKKKFSLIEIDTGSLLRRFIKQKGYLSQKTAEVIAKGDLVPFWLVVNIWLKKILNISLDKGIIFEGSPRSLEEAKILDEALNWLGRNNIRVIYLNVKEKEVIRRLSLRRICSQCGREYSLEFRSGLKKCLFCEKTLIRRADDYPKAIKNRMFYFQKNIIPVINYFRNKKILVEINGLGTVEEVYQQITKTLKTKAV
ncbi:MAG: nucleoside monophosphate kinase [Candidatus Paceibacterota bacterium]|jgi:adenylate kinase